MIHALEYFEFHCEFAKVVLLYASIVRDFKKIKKNKIENGIELDQSANIGAMLYDFQEQSFKKVFIGNFTYITVTP
jgi:hypothetical protein